LDFDGWVDVVQPALALKVGELGVFGRDGIFEIQACELSAVVLLGFVGELEGEVEEELGLFCLGGERRREGGMCECVCDGKVGCRERRREVRWCDRWEGGESSTREPPKSQHRKRRMSSRLCFGGRK